MFEDWRPSAEASSGCMAIKSRDAYVVAVPYGVSPYTSLFKALSVDIPAASWPRTRLAPNFGVLQDHITSPPAITVGCKTCERSVLKYRIPAWVTLSTILSTASLMLWTDSMAVFSGPCPRLRVRTRPWPGLPGKGLI